MDKIILKNISVFAYHGAISEENRLGQRFFIDCTLFKSLKEAGAEDNLLKTVHYGEVYEEIVSIATLKQYKLIEALAEEITKQLINKFEIEKVILQIRKPSAPIAGILDYAAIEIERNRNDYAE